MGVKEITTDVLVVGGGPGACFAAIKAKEAGAKQVTMVCKAAAGSSGSGMYMVGTIATGGLKKLKAFYLN